MSEPRRSSPYVGLAPYAEKDADFFFGRERERQVVAGNLLASRLTIVYGPSGVGKSSVLRAGVARDLRLLAQRNKAELGQSEFAVVVFDSWRDDPVAGLVERCAAELERVSVAAAARDTVDPPDWPFPPGSDHSDLDLLIILDQFEEYFLYHQAEDGPGTLAVELPRAVEDLDRRVNFIVSVREDALARLDRFKGRIGDLFGNYLRIDHLSRAAAEEAIRGPIRRYNELYRSGREPVQVEDDLVATVLDEVQTGRVALGDAGLGAHPTHDEGGARGRVETPFLQLVMKRLWEEEVERNHSSILRLKTLQDPPLGGAHSIVQAHLDTVMASLDQREKAAAARAFQYLVTPSGGKIAYPVPDLAGQAGIDEASLMSVLEKLSRGDVRLLRSVGPAPGSPPEPRFERYEIFHDVLAPGILAWRTQFVHDEERVKRQRELRRLQGVAAVLAAAVIITALALQFARRAHRESFDFALNAVDSTLAPVYRAAGDDARYAPELEALRIAQLNRSLPSYRDLLRRRPGSERAGERLAFAHLTLGNIHRSLLDYPEADREYQEAIARLAPLAGSDPDGTRHRQALANAYNWLGETRRESGADPAPALAAYDSALILLQQLHGEHPDSIGYRQDLAQTLSNRAALQARRSDADSASIAMAEKDFRAAAALLEPAAGDGAEQRTLRELGRVYNNLGAFAWDRLREQEAHEWYRKAVAIHEQLVRENPTTREYQIELEKFYLNLADISRERDQLELAAEQSRKAIDLIEKLAQPVPIVWVDLADAHNVRGWIVEAAQGSAAALREFRQSLEILERLSRDPLAWALPEYHERFEDLLRSLVELRADAETTRLLDEARAAYLVLGNNIAQSGSPSDAGNMLASMANVGQQLFEQDGTLAPAFERVRQRLQQRAEEGSSPQPGSSR